MASIHTLDLRYLDRPQRVASFLVMSDAGPILIETGPGSTWDRLVAALDDYGVQPRDIAHALLTHIHFDHAGAAGLLAEHGAIIHVHEFGAQHLIDPSKLIASATRIYGDDMGRLWGRIVPIPAEQVRPVHDGDVLEFGDLRFTAIETPGHARHHHSFRMEAAGAAGVEGVAVCFTGDIAAEILPNVPGPQFLSLPTPPPEFDREAWLASLERLKREQFAALYLTHFGRVDEVEAHLDAVADALRRHSDFIIAAMDEGKDEANLREPYRAWLREQAQSAGVPEETADHYIASMVSMNITGIMRYWRKRAQ